MLLLQTPRFSKQLKKLKKNQKEALDEAVKMIMAKPLIGTQKRGELGYLRTYKFLMLKQQALLTYSYDDDGKLIIKLLAMGSYETFIVI
ncbi:type II toxin-antitoxin system RelE/ParE family toxin [Mariprofundus ferrooxydans]|nr:type II toxin-antitoxin system RelE/ParE family toxin [Mariprofundus ferrooxydans]